MRWKRVVVWFGIYLVVVFVAGCFDTGCARSRDRMICRDPAQSLALVTIRGDEYAVVGLDSSEPFAAESAGSEVVAGTLRWQYAKRVLEGSFFPCYRHDRAVVYLDLWPSAGAVALGSPEATLAALRPALVELLMTDPEYGAWDKIAPVFLGPNVDNTGSIWTGQICNGLLYSTIITPLLYGLWRLHLLNEMLKRRQELRRSLLCPKCKYDLGGDRDAGCPECGWGRDREAETRRRR